MPAVTKVAIRNAEEAKRGTQRGLGVHTARRGDAVLAIE